MSDQHGSKRTMEELTDEFLDAVSQEFGFAVNLKDTPHSGYDNEIGNLYDAIAMYARESIVEEICRQHPRLALRPDHETQAKYLTQIVEELADIPNRNIAPFDGDLQAVIEGKKRRNVERIVSNIPENADPEDIRKRFLKVADAVKMSLFMPRGYSI